MASKALAWLVLVVCIGCSDDSETPVGDIGGLVDVGVTVDTKAAFDQGLKADVSTWQDCIPGLPVSAKLSDWDPKVGCLTYITETHKLEAWYGEQHRSIVVVEYLKTQKHFWISAGYGWTLLQVSPGTYEPGSTGVGGLWKGTSPDTDLEGILYAKEHKAYLKLKWRYNTDKITAISACR